MREKMNEQIVALWNECVQSAFQEVNQNEKKQMEKSIVAYLETITDERKKQIIADIILSNESIISTMKMYRTTEKMLKEIKENQELLSVILL